MKNKKFFLPFVVVFVLLLLCGFRMHEKDHITTLADLDSFIMEDASDSNVTKYTTVADFKTYMDNYYCLESVLGTSIGDGLLLDGGTVLKASTILQKYHGVDPSVDVLAMIGSANDAALRTEIGAYGSGDAPTFETVNTGQGAYELYAMNQDVESTDNVTFAIITGKFGQINKSACNVTLTAAECSNTLITNWGWNATADQIFIMPASVAGLKVRFKNCVTDATADIYWDTPGSTTQFILEVTPCGDGERVWTQDATIYEEISFYTMSTNASNVAYDWHCCSIQGVHLDKGS